MIIKKYVPLVLVFSLVHSVALLSLWTDKNLQQANCTRACGQTYKNCVNTGKTKDECLKNMNDCQANCK
jgi:hypothetical protein